MAVFAYKAIEADHRSSVNGTIAADTPRAARDLLRAKGLTLQELRSQRVVQPATLWRPRRSRHAAKVYAFIRELATLLSVGTPLLEAIDTITGQHRGGFRASLLMLRDRVAGGVSLAEAMREQPNVFDDMCVHLTEVGENSGTLDVVLDRLAEFKERSSQFKSKLATALVYPAIVLCLGIGVSIFLMTFVVPQLLENLVAAGKPLPLTTRLVKSASDFLVQRWWLLILMIGGVMGLISLTLRTQAGRYAWHRLQLRIPVVGDMVRKQAVLHMAVVLSTLLKSDVVFLVAIQIVKKSTSNLAMKNALSRFETAVGAGADIAKAMEGTNVFPPVVIQVFSIGQQSGRLEEMLDKLAADYDRQLSTAAARLTAVLEPVLILFLAGIVGLIAFATILPILEASNVL